MRQFGAGLVVAPPGGPVQDMLGGGRGLPNEREEEAPHLRYGQRQQLGEGHRLVWPRSFLWVRPPFPSGSCRARRRTTVRYARANIARVRWRYQPVQVRTSYSSRPTSPLASSKACSTCQRVPATWTTCGSVTSAGPNTK